MMFPRAAFRAVQVRVGILRRAVIAEVEDINRAIYHVLRGGVLLSVAFILFAFLLASLGAEDLPNRSLPLRDLVPEVLLFTPAGYMNLGILVLIFTPMARVFVSFLAFAEERERLFLGITLIVLLNLLASFLAVA